MSSQPVQKSLAEYFPPDDGRMRVLAMCATSQDSQSRIGAWAWLLDAEQQAKALLYTGFFKTANPDHLAYAAIGALGRHLGFSAQVLALMPGVQSIDLRNLDFVPRRMRLPIQLNYDCGRSNLAKSHFTLGPDIFAAWPGAVLLKNIATRAHFRADKPTCEIIERCPKCDELILDGICGCEQANLIFPNFHVPATTAPVINLVTRFNLQGWLGKYSPDYTRKTGICPKCFEALIPVADNDIQWKCAHCGSEYDGKMREHFIGAKIISMPEPIAPAIEQESALALMAAPTAISTQAAPVRSKRQMSQLPTQFLNSISSLYPDVWKKVDEVREEFMDAKGRHPWDSSIFLPGSYWKGILTYYNRTFGTPANSAAFYRLMFAGTWLPTQDIVSFDPDLYDALVTTPLEGKLPWRTLTQFPALCMYFDSPGLTVIDEKYDGFFAMLDENWGYQQLCLNFLREDSNCYMPPIRLGNWDLKEGFLSNFRESKLTDKTVVAKAEAAKLIFDQGITAAINLILYAFSQTNGVREKA